MKMFGKSPRGRVVTANVETKKEQEEREAKELATTTARINAASAALAVEQQAILDYLAEQRADATEPQVHYRLDRVTEFIKSRMGNAGGAA